MREGWGKRRLGEIAHFPTRRVSSLFVNAENYVGVDNLVKDRGGKVKAAIVPQDGSCIEYKNGDILLGNIRPYLKKIWLANNEGGASGDVIVVRPNNPFEIIPAFLCWCLSADDFFEYDMLHSKGAKMPRGNKADILKYEISIPPIRQQEMAVAELDCLTGIIEKKKQQLEELDNLAQSIFYDMFGDPITNEKGWEVRRLGTFSNSELGKMLDVKRNKGEAHPYLCSINVQWGHFDLNPLKQMGFEDDELERYSVKKGDLLICEGGDTGRCAIWKEDYTIFYQNALHRVRFDEKVMLPIVCLFVMKTYKDNGEMDKYSKGQTIKHLVKKTLLSIPMITPPIDLQNEFAKKIEAIEKQKELVKRSIVETETLFNSRMDYWFN